MSCAFRRQHFVRLSVCHKSWSFTPISATAVIIIGAVSINLYQQRPDDVSTAPPTRACVQLAGARLPVDRDGVLPVFEWRGSECRNGPALTDDGTPDAAAVHGSRQVWAADQRQRGPTLRRVFKLKFHGSGFLVAVSYTHLTLPTIYSV